MPLQRLERSWFVLFEQKDQMAFLYFQDEDHFLERKKNKGFFRFDDATSVDVIKDYMGRKNAFCIATPRAKYYIVSESRWGSSDICFFRLAVQHAYILCNKPLRLVSTTGHISVQTKPITAVIVVVVVAVALPGYSPHSFPGCPFSLAH